ncbi:MAG: glycosyltransferase family 4 protein [Leptospiraceae bacterium]|nr:glycosyltransferase family 4 protein [Leptospiraceae bacterium]
MILGIDASNIRGGGGVVHLVELLRAAEPQKYQFEKVFVWGGTSTLDKIEDRNWLEKVYEPLLNKSLLHRTYWQKFLLSKRAKQVNCDILFIPGGTYSGGFRPFVTMSQNLLPFEVEEIKRYGFSLFAIKMKMLRITQSKTFKSADGVIYLTEFARERVLTQLNKTKENTVIVHHGINSKFYGKPKEQKEISEYSTSNPYKLLYVSFIGEYKHQWNVVKAVDILRRKNMPLELTLIGNPDEKKAFIKLKETISKVDPENRYIKYYSGISHQEIESFYKGSDLFVFASSCETFGQILTEAMASGLPIACSEMSAMPELLGEAGVFFNPLKPDSISDSIEKLIMNKNFRVECSSKAYNKAQKFSWEKCAEETFLFFNRIALTNISSN